MTPIFALSDRAITEMAALNPLLATFGGVPGHDAEMTDLSPDGEEVRAAQERALLAEIRALEPTNEDDRIAKGFIEERLEAAGMRHDLGEWMVGLNAIAAPACDVRAVFDLMDRDGEQAWANIAARLRDLPATMEGLTRTYELGRSRGIVAAARQVHAAADQAATWAGDRWFDSLVAEAEAAALPAALVADIRSGAEGANTAFDRFAQYLRGTYLPDASPTDGCGPERYRVAVREFLGADLDPQEMYDWAWTDFHSLRADIRRTCAEILPGGSFAEVIHLLDTDPARAVHGVDAYQAWLQDLTDEALARSKAHFEIPPQIDRCEARIPPEGSGAAAYYTGPSEDFSRPGRTWYPALGRTMFPKWGDVTTCYHESVPGHHLQIAYAKLQAGSLSRMQRNGFISGHGEGWALYAEQLCDEFGWFRNADERLGFLGGQILRTVRVIIDIGMHLGYRIPEGTTLNDGTPFHGGEVWNADLAFEFAVKETGNTEAFMRSEIDRYLGWPGQAISYKIGQREWVAARDEAMARDGDAFDLKAWHTRALKLGAIGLGQLRTELAR